MLTLLCLSVVIWESWSFQAQDKPPPPFELKDGDRVVLLGGAYIEREQLHGQLEMWLHVMFPQRRFTVRNLGWSGDTVWGEARAGFGKQPDGFKKLVDQVNAEKPTVLILGYGLNEAFAGEAGVEHFTEGYEKLLQAVGADKLRLVFLTPPTFRPENYPRTIDATRYHEHLNPLYSRAIHGLAKKYRAHCPHIILFHQFKANELIVSDDGILPNASGYRTLGLMFAREMGYNFDDDPEFRRAKTFDNSLRLLILKKNELYFHRYRPQNDTYLFGFRKHEQGQNAREVPQFDPMVEELDRKIIETKLKIVSEKK